MKTVLSKSNQPIVVKEVPVYKNHYSLWQGMILAPFRLRALAFMQKKMFLFHPVVSLLIVPACVCIWVYLGMDL